MTSLPDIEALPAARQCASRYQRLRMIRTTVEDNLGTDVATVEQVLGHSVKGGKGMRGLVAHISCDWCGLSRESCNEIAAAMEMIHVASLLHDDIVDDADVRRHRSSANKEFGSDTAVLAGDFLYSRSSQLLCQTDCVALLKEIADATNLLAEGEVMQLGNKGAIATEQEYFEIIRRKTAVLFAASAAAGPLVAGMADKIAPLRTYGEQLGMAFQLVDDCLDYASSEQESGKMPGVDFAAGKVTLPLLRALGNASASQRRELEGIFANRAEPGAFEQMLEILEATEALAEVEQEAARHIDNAVQALAALGGGGHADMLATMARRSASRLS